VFVVCVVRVCVCVHCVVGMYVVCVGVCVVCGVCVDVVVCVLCVWFL